MTDAWPGTPVGNDSQWPGTPKQTQQRGVIDKLLGETGPRYQLWPERAVRAIGSLPERFFKSAGVAAPGTPESVEAEVGPAFEAATLAMPMGKTGAPLTVRGAGAAPTQEALREIISGQYKELDQLGIQIPQKDVAGLADEIRQDLMHGQENGGHRPLNQPGTFGLLDELKTTNGRFSDLDSVRKALGKVRKDVAKNKSDSEAAGVAIRKIDDFLDRATGETGEKAKAVRGNVIALKRSEDISAAKESAELSAATSGSGANMANRLRQNIKWFIDPKYPWRKMGFKPDEIELMEQIARGGKAENIARLISKLGPKHPLSGWGVAAAADLGGGSGLATASLATGAIAQWLSEHLPLSKINRLDEMIRSRAPAAANMPKQPLVSVNPLTALYGGGAAPLIAGAPDRFQTQQLPELSQ